MLPPARFFPPVEQSTPEGLLALGGRLDPEWLLDAYSHGIFPWPFSDGGPMAWWSPDPRAIIELDGLHVSRRLQRTIRSGKFRVTCDRDFFSVIRGCARENGRQDATWITPEILSAYVRLHRLGHAHSIEVWCEERLAGGTYGVSIGGLFAAESKFYRVRDASKVAVVYLVAHLRARGYRLLDIQQRTAHTARLGATTIRRGEYLRRLAKCLPLEVTFGDHLEGDPVLGLGA